MRGVLEAAQSQSDVIDYKVAVPKGSDSFRGTGECAAAATAQVLHSCLPLHLPLSRSLHLPACSHTS